MPDAAPATAAAPAASAAAPEVAAPAAAETPAPSAPQTPAKQTEHQRVKAAAEILEKAGSAKQSTAPEAPTDKPEGETPKPEDDQPRDITVAEWRKYKTLKGRLEKREEQMAAKEQAYAARDQAVAHANQRIQAFQQREKLLLENPRAFWELVAKERGTTFTQEYEKFANGYLDEGKPESQIATTQRELKDLREQLAQRDQQSQQQRIEAQRAQLANAFLGVAATDSHPDTRYTLQKYGAQTVIDDAVNVGTELANKLRRPATDAEIAKELDARYAAYYDGIQAGRKPAAAQGGAAQAGNPGRPQGVAPQQGTVEPANAVAPKAPTTLTNGGSATRVASGRKLTDAQKIAAAAALMPDMPRPRGV